MTAVRVNYMSHVTSSDPVTVASPGEDETCLTSAAVEVVRRCLFGPTDQHRTRADLESLSRQFDVASRQRWNFDFKVGSPLPTGRYAWTEVVNAKMTTDRGSPASRLVSKTRGGRSKHSAMNASGLSVYVDEQVASKCAESVQRRLSCGSVNICSPGCTSSPLKLVDCVRQPLRQCSPVEQRFSPRQSAVLRRRHSCVVVPSKDKMAEIADIKKSSPIVERRRKSRPSSIVGEFELSEQSKHTRL